MLTVKVIFGTKGNRKLLRKLEEADFEILTYDLVTNVYQTHCRKIVFRNDDNTRIVAIYNSNENCWPSQELLQALDADPSVIQITLDKRVD